LRFSLYALTLAWLLQLNSGCTTLQPLELAPTTAPVPAQATLWKELTTIRRDDWFHLLNTGDDALEWRLRAIDSATHSLDLQTFLWKGDTTGLILLRHILIRLSRENLIPVTNGL